MATASSAERKLIQVGGASGIAHVVVSVTALSIFLLNPSIGLQASPEQVITALTSTSAQSMWFISFVGFAIECLLNIAFILGVFVLLRKSTYVLILLGTAFAFLSIAVFEVANSTLAISGIVLGNAYANASATQKPFLVAEMQVLLATGLSLQQMGIFLSAATGLVVGPAIVRSRKLSPYLGWYLLGISVLWLVGLLPWAFTLQIVGFFLWFVWVFTMGVTLLRYEKRLGSSV
jgi:hypothetical protein